MMNKIALGVIAGLLLGLLDGLSAFLVPEAADMMFEIIVGSTVKGLLTGLFIGMFGFKIKTLTGNIILGAFVGLLFSILAALSTGTYLQIIIPGVIIGILLGLIVKKWGR